MAMQFSEAPSAASLPKPPSGWLSGPSSSHWTPTGTSIHQHKDQFQEISNQLKMLLNIKAWECTSQPICQQQLPAPFIAGLEFSETRHHQSVKPLLFHHLLFFAQTARSKAKQCICLRPWMIFWFGFWKTGWPLNYPHHKAVSNN